MSVTTKDLAAMAETLKTAFNGMADEMAQAIKEAKEEYGTQTPYINGAEQLTAMAKLADSITRISAEIRAHRPLNNDPFGR